MVKSLAKKIQDLEDELKKLLVVFDKAEQELDHLESKNKKEILAKEKELEAWREKVEVCHQENIKLKQELRNQAQQIEKTDLPSPEKQVKINHLLTQYQEEFVKVDKMLYEERTHYRLARNKLIRKLCEDCSLCEEKEKRIIAERRLNTTLEDRVGKMQILSGIFFLSGIICFLLFLYTIHTYIKLLKQREREREREQKGKLEKKKIGT